MGAQSCDYVLAYCRCLAQALNNVLTHEWVLLSELHRFIKAYCPECSLAGESCVR